MKIAVTGASGFIGRYVLAELANCSIEAIAITRNRSHLQNMKATFRIVELDISNAGNDEYERIGRPDILIHLAWNGLPNYTSSHHIDIELPRQYQFLKGLVDAGLPSILVTGTCFEYGMQTGALSESVIPSPSNPYGSAKDLLRRKLQSLQMTRSFSLTWARLFYIYGEGQSGNSLYSQLKESVSRGDPVFNMSGGEQLRDYLPGDEVARLIVQLAVRMDNLGIVNVCSGKPVSVRELVESWISRHHWNIQLNLGYYPYPDHEPMAFWGNRKRLDEILGRRP